LQVEFDYKNVIETKSIAIIEKLIKKTNMSEAIETEKHEIKERRKKSDYIHKGNTCGDLWPEAIDQIVEVGESVNLQGDVGLVQHGQHATG
jgi:hypothetical protein